MSGAVSGTPLTPGDRSEAADSHRGTGPRWRWRRAVVAIIVVAVMAMALMWMSMQKGSTPDEMGSEGEEFEAYQGAFPDEEPQRPGPDSPTPDSRESKASLESDRPAQEPGGVDQSDSNGVEEVSQMGPRRWMAEAEDVDVQALEERLRDSEMDQEFELALRRDRRASIDAADDFISACYAERDEELERGAPQRVAVEWTIATHGGAGVIEAPRILHQLGAKDERFERCVLDGLDGLDFEAVGDDGEMVVREAFYRR